MTRKYNRSATIEMIDLYDTLGLEAFEKEIVDEFAQKNADMYILAALAIQNSNDDAYLSVLENALEYPLDINRQTKKGRTLLMHAVLKEDVEAVRLLIENGADLSIQDNKGNNVLDYLDVKAYQEAERDARPVSKQIKRMRDNEVPEVYSEDIERYRANRFRFDYESGYQDAQENFEEMQRIIYDAAYEQAQNLAPRKVAKRGRPAKTIRNENTR